MNLKHELNDSVDISLTNSVDIPATDSMYNSVNGPTYDAVLNCVFNPTQGSVHRTVKLSINSKLEEYGFKNQTQ